MSLPENIIELQCGHNYVDYSAVHNVTRSRMAPSSSRAVGRRRVVQHDVVRSNPRGVNQRAADERESAHAEMSVPQYPDTIIGRVRGISRDRARAREQCWQPDPRRRLVHQWLRARLYRPRVADGGRPAPCLPRQQDGSVNGESAFCPAMARRMRNGSHSLIA